MNSDKERPPTPYSELGRALLQLRTERGWSLRRAAAMIGDIKHSRLQDFERGADPHSARPTRPTEEQIRAIAKAYGTDPTPLLRLAGYVSIGPLEPWEEDLVIRARALPEHAREGVVEYLTKLAEAPSDES